MRAFHHSVAIEERNGPVAFTIIHPHEIIPRTEANARHHKAQPQRR
jgi:hypothetical protein